MQNIDITKGKPFLDKNVKKTLTLLERETPQFNNISYATWSNPSTTERTFIQTSGNVAVDKLTYDVNCMVNLTSNITGIQTFTFKLYLGSEVIADSIVTVPDALNTLFSVRLNGNVTYTRISSGDPKYVGSLIATPLATDETAAISTITVLGKQHPVVGKAEVSSVLDLKLTCTASVGTTTTVVTCMGGRVLFDKN